MTTDSKANIQLVTTKLSHNEHIFNYGMKVILNYKRILPYLMSK